MQKQTKQILVVIALLLVFGAAYGGMRIYNDRQEKQAGEEAEAAKTYIAGIKAEEITAFSYQSGEETLHFAKEEGTWISQEDEGLQLNQTAVADMADTIAELEAEDTVEEAKELSEYGFDTPANVITVTTAEGSSTLTIGMQNSITSQYYLTKSGEDTLYLVSGSFPSAFGKTLEDLEDTTEDTEEAVSETEE